MQIWRNLRSGTKSKELVLHDYSVKIVRWQCLRVWILTSCSLFHYSIEFLGAFECKNSCLWTALGTAHIFYGHIFFALFSRILENDQCFGDFHPQPTATTYLAPFRIQINRVGLPFFFSALPLFFTAAFFQNGLHSLKHKHVKNSYRCELSTSVK